MDISRENIILQKEKVYFYVLVIFAILFWLFVLATIVGPLFVLAFAFMGWLANGLFIARLKSDCVLITEQQMPELYGTFRQVCSKLELTKLPELYVVQSQGMLNAFAIRHSGRNFVVLYSDIVEAYGQSSDEMRFVIGHEIGHIQRKHILKLLFLGPARILPLIGTAYSRACEATCDRYGAFAVNNIGGALTAMMILSGGKESGRLMSSEAFSQQWYNHRGFFVSWYELISGYPTLAQRVANIIAIKNNSKAPKVSRHPISYVFAFFTFGGGGSGLGNIFITVAIIAILASIAIPNLLRAKLSANDAVARSEIYSLANALIIYSQDHDGEFPSDPTVLVNSKVPYIDKVLCGKESYGYTYQCALSKNDFQLTATPVMMGTTGTQEYQISKEDFLPEPELGQIEEQEKSGSSNQFLLNLNRE